MSSSTITQQTSPPTSPLPPTDRAPSSEPPQSVPASPFEEPWGSGVYRQRGITLVRGEGAHLWDEDGRQWIDCMSAHGTALLGHAHPRLQQAIAEQAGQLLSCPGTFGNGVRERFLERLAAVSGFSRFFLANSGTEAVEAALKFATLTTGRSGLVAIRRAFHGRTTGSLGVTWNRKYRLPFRALLPEAVHLPPEDLAAAEAAIDENTAAVLVEPVQGEGGVHPLRASYLEGLRHLAKTRGALLIFDEVQTGCGRTGRWFAYEHSAVKPDLLCLAKGLAGGVPIGAVALGDRVGPLPPGSHGSTFGGNPLSCAAGLATLETLQEEKLFQRAQQLGAYALETLRRELADCRRVREVRGLGLMIGIELRQRVTPLLQTLMEEDHILALPAGQTVLRLLPPLVIDEADWFRVVDTIIQRLRQGDTP